MTTQDYVECFLVAMLGMVIQTSFKLNAMHKKAIVGNTGVNVVKEYFKSDFWAIIANLAFVGVCLLVAREWLMSEYILGKIKSFFAFVGWAGSDLANRIFTRTNDKLNQIIDIKTDKADGIK
jgi:hypothetical protein